MANQVRTTDPMRALYDAIVFNSRDFAASKFEAWIWGIVVGWDDEDDDDTGAMDEIASQLGWTAAEVTQLRQLRTNWKRLEAAAEEILTRDGEGP